jgi:hypothetical protein
VLFDRTVFLATKLPILIHDTVVFENIEKDSLTRLQRVLKKSVLLKGTASAVPQVTHLQCGFSRRGTLFRHGDFFSTFFRPGEGR